ncbi:hypothetical protein [Arthrobacter sp. RCC_34]|uniref:hypothetical protein n=1 Tax=Arthrobacter sp. RCC_34 TaxID=3239230 RepID=UPI003525B693
MKILVLTIQTNDYKFVNNFLIPESLHRQGHEVALGDVDTLSYLQGVIQCKQATFEGGAVGEPHVIMDEMRSCEDFDLVWVLDYSHPDREKEFFQLLWLLERRVPFVNDPSGLFFMNNKIGIAALDLQDNLPESFVSCDEETLRQVCESNGDISWVIKPPNAGCGADVFKLTAGDANFSALLQSATGNAYQKYEMFTREAFGQAEKYAVLQEFLPELKGTEKRVMIADGKVVGGFKKTGKGAEFRGNASTGGDVGALELNADELALSEKIGERLKDFGIRFVGIDMAYPYLVELNLVNPGGINYHRKATGEDIADLLTRTAVDGALAAAAR